MPNVGSGVFGIYPDLREEQQNILQYGISIFQLIYPKRTFSNQNIFGPFNVRVTQTEQENVRSARPRFNVKWFTEGNAYITFERTRDKKTAIAWMPDDPYWHNRLTLMDQQALLRMVSQLRLPDNSIKTAPEIQLEIACMERVLKEKKPYFKILLSGNIFGGYWTREEAQEYIDEQTTMRPKITEQGTIVPITKSKKNFKIVEETRIDYKDDIKKLIHKETNKHPFGWSECTEFQESIKPEVIKLIKKQRGGSTGTQMALSDAIKVITALSDEEKSALRDALKPAKKEKEVVS